MNQLVNIFSATDSVLLEQDKDRAAGQSPRTREAGEDSALILLLMASGLRAKS